MLSTIRPYHTYILYCRKNLFYTLLTQLMNKKSFQSLTIHIQAVLAEKKYLVILLNF